VCGRMTSCGVYVSRRCRSIEYCELSLNCERRMVADFGLTGKVGKWISTFAHGSFKLQKGQTWVTRPGGTNSLTEGRPDFSLPVLRDGKHPVFVVMPRASCVRRFRGSPCRARRLKSAYAARFKATLAQTSPRGTGATCGLGPRGFRA